MYLGIDLGTTNSVVSRSFVDANDNLVTEVVRLGQFYNDGWEKYDSLPSMVYFSEDGKIVGREAKRLRNMDRAHVITNTKRFMGTKHTWHIDGEEYEAKDIGAMVLQHCKKVIELEGNMKYESVVITVPASFNPDQIGDTIRAAKQAGFKEDQVTIKHEPTAALLSFIDKEFSKPEKDRIVDFSTTKRILVFDLGGGTCDTSIIDAQVAKEGITFTERGIGRYQELGGIDFDARVAEGLLNKFFADNKIEDGMLTKEQIDEMYRKLLLGAETLKEKLSATISNKMVTEPEVDFETVSAKLSLPKFYNNEPLRLELTKREYDEYTKILYTDTRIRYKTFEEMDKNKNIITIIRKTLEDYGIQKSSIDYIFMTGGMSKFLTVRQKVEEYLSKPVIMPEDPMTAVARGASIYKHYQVKEVNESRTLSETEIANLGNLQNASTQSAGQGITDHMMLAEAVLLDVNEGLPRVIIPKKTLVPYSGELNGAFFTTSPAGIKLNIYAAEDEYDSSMRMQKSLEKAFTFPVKSGTPFDIKYTINENKEISMKIIINDAMHPQELDLSVYSDLNISEQNYDLVME